MGLDDAKTAIDMLIPPHDADGPEVRRWRVYIAILTGVNALMLIFFVALAFGWLPFFHGFASAAEVTSLQQESDARYADELDAQIMAYRINQCTSLQAPKNEVAARQYWDKINDRMYKWSTIKKAAYRLPPCSEL